MNAAQVSIQLRQALEKLERLTANADLPLDCIPLSLTKASKFDAQPSDGLFPLIGRDKSIKLNASLFRRFIAGIIYRLIVKEFDASLLIRCADVFNGIADCRFTRWRQAERVTLTNVIIEGLKCLLKHRPDLDDVSDDALDWIVENERFSIVDTPLLLSIWDDAILAEGGDQATIYSASLFLNLLGNDVDSSLPRRFGEQAATMFPALSAWTMRPCLVLKWKRTLSAINERSDASLLSRCIEIRETLREL